MSPATDAQEAAVNTDTTVNGQPASWPPTPWPIVERRTRTGRRGWTSHVRVQRPALRRPLRWTAGRTIEVSPGQDLACDDVPRAALGTLLAAVAATPQHQYLLASARPADLARLLAGSPNPLTTWPLSNLWLGAHVDDLPRADLTETALLRTAGALWLDARRLHAPAQLDDLLSSPVRDRIALVLTDPSRTRPSWAHEAWTLDVIQACEAAQVPHRAATPASTRRHRPRPTVPTRTPELRVTAQLTVN